MIHPEVDKNTMPDGSAPLHSEAVHAQVSMPMINGAESPLAVPESPEDKGIIRCICGIDEDDGFTIFCDRCSVWQHGACVGIYEAKDAPDKYLCDQCNPRPLDVQKAIRIQRLRQDVEQNNLKPKRRTANHSKTKPNHHNNTSLGPTPSLPPPPSRKEKHPSPPRRTEGKRPKAPTRQSTQQAETVVHEEVDVVNDEDPDIPLWPSAEDYEHRERNEFSPEITNLLERTIQQFEKASMEDLRDGIELLHSIQDYAHKTLRQPISRKSTHAYTNFVRQFGLFAAEPMSENDLISEVIGQIGLAQKYKSDPINQYSTLQRPKPYVLFAPPDSLDLYVDSRLYGNDARYVRRSCFPNARIALICVPDADERGIHFGLFASKNIKTRDEITIGHDWNMSNKMEEMIAGIKDETRPLLEVYPQEIIRSMASYAITVLLNGECACHDDHCTFIRLRKAFASLPEPSSRQNSSDHVDAMSIEEAPTEEDTDMEDDSRPTSRGTQNRDRTPSKDIVDANAPKTAREQRKIDQAMARFAQMEEKEKEKSSDRRKKSDTIEPDDSINKRRRQSSVTAEARPVASRAPSSKGRGVKRKSMSPSPGVDRISESGTSMNESPKPGGRVPNRVKRSMKGRKEPSNKKVRVQPPEQEEVSQESSLPKWVKRSTLSDSWTPPQQVWYKLYQDLAKREYEESMKESSEMEVQMSDTIEVKDAPPTEVASPPVPSTRTAPNLHVAMPSQGIFVRESEQSPMSSATPSQPSTSYFPSTATAASLPPASPVSTPLTPKVKLSLADYRARRASGMATPSTPTTSDSLHHSEFVLPPPPTLQDSKSPDTKSADLPPS